jgi:hypothetical protein
MHTGRTLIPLLGFAAAGFVVAVGAAQAQITSADVGVNPTYEQTDMGVASTGGFFSARAFFTSSTDFSGGTLTYGGSGSPAALSYVPADVALELGDSNSSFPVLQSLYPVGDYTFDLTGGTMGPASLTMDYVGDTYAASPPELDAASYSALQGMNAADPLTVDFNSFETTGSPTNSDIVFTVLNSSFVPVWTSFLLSTATDVTIPGGTLAAGQSYTFDLLFSSQIGGTAGDPFTITQFYDTHTDGSFFTAVPEPSTWAMMLVGFAGLGYVGYRARNRSVAPIAG